MNGYKVFDNMINIVGVVLATVCIMAFFLISPPAKTYQVKTICSFAGSGFRIHPLDAL